MLTLCYAGKSAPSALAIARATDEITPVRSGRGDVNWGRATANTQLNPDISNTTNKRVMRELFREHDVPMPELVSISDLQSDLARDIPRKVVGRPDRHSKGRGLWLVTDRDSARKALRGTRRKAAATHFMEYVEAPHEYRVHIFLGKSIRISEKEFFTDASGKRDYTTIKPTGNVKHVRKAAKKALAAVGLDFGAVDILASDSQCWVLEVNAAPGLGGSTPQLYAEAFKKWKDNDV